MGYAIRTAELERLQQNGCLVCHCPSPIEERFWFPGAVQCARCKRAIAKYLSRSAT